MNIFKVIFGTSKFKPIDNREKKIIEIVEQFCKNPEARLQYLINGNSYLTLNEQHYDIVISGTYVTIANTDRVTREQFRESFIKELSSMINKRIEDDLKKVLSNIEERDNALLERMLDAVRFDDVDTDNVNDDDNDENIQHG